MIFNSFSFAIFLPLTFALYWGIFGKSYRSQNVLLLVASYIFYGWWDYRFLVLLFLSTIVDFYVGRKLSEEINSSIRKGLLALSICFNLGLLGFFKYFNFFIESWNEAWSQIGVEMAYSSWSIILPVGISFYTFQTLSYTIDVYKKRILPTSNVFDFALYVAFFPQLIAGPIERAQKLLPQLTNKRNFNLDQAKSGLHLILWGLFKKIVIADNCAIYANEIFENYENLDSITLLLGAIFFSLQIYGDFSGYSDIAIGTARLLGINLMRNFNYPYFSRNIGEFWRRWHISLSTWFRDYLYIPIGGSRGSTGHTIRNIFIIFIISGLWHGANWTFVIWGGLHAFLFMPILLLKRNRTYIDTPGNGGWLPGVKEGLQIITTFLIVTFLWIFFRAENLQEALGYINRLFRNFQYLELGRNYIELILLLLFFFTIEWFHRTQEHPFTGKFKIIKIIITILLILLIGVHYKHHEFIYFQF